MQALLAENRMTITWTKCADEMPPDDSPFKLIILRDINSPIKTLSRLYSWRLKMLRNANKYEWTPYTHEVWDELDRK